MQGRAADVTGHKSLEMLKPTAATPKHSSIMPARDCSE
jgi:hypothetical protein